MFPKIQKNPRKSQGFIAICFVYYFANTYLTPKVTEDKFNPKL